MNPEPIREFIADTLAQPVLDPRPRALYELCHMHRHHGQGDIVADKLRMIVRLLADAGLPLGGFSPEYVAHRLVRSGVDGWFSAIATAERIEPPLLFEVHGRAMGVFSELPPEQARAIASTYLHFHFPELFFLYDPKLTAAAYALGGTCGDPSDCRHDPEYGRFFACCEELTHRLIGPAGRRLTPRELDRVLRAWADRSDLAAPAGACQAAEDLVCA